jgi:predicted nuclease of predicted toxin-antitoxin system
MKILLDESLPRRLKKDLAGHAVRTVPEMGWQGKKNGELLKLLQDQFDVFLTSDQNMQYQVNLRNTIVPIIVLKSVPNRYEDLVKLVPKILKILASKELKGVVRVE